MAMIYISSKVGQMVKYIAELILINIFFIVLLMLMPFIKIAFMFHSDVIYNCKVRCRQINDYIFTLLIITFIEIGNLYSCFSRVSY